MARADYPQSPSGGESALTHIFLLTSLSASTPSSKWHNCCCCWLRRRPCCYCCRCDCCWCCSFCTCFKNVCVFFFGFLSARIVRTSRLNVHRHRALAGTNPFKGHATRQPLKESIPQSRQRLRNSCSQSKRWFFCVLCSEGKQKPTELIGLFVAMKKRKWLWCHSGSVAVCVGRSRTEVKYLFEELIFSKCLNFP